MRYMYPLDLASLTTLRLHHPNSDLLYSANSPSPTPCPTAPAYAASQRRDGCVDGSRKLTQCDHTRPVCGSCSKLSLDCEYPPPQARRFVLVPSASADTRGPVAGLSKRAEARVQQCENALWFLMNMPEVQDAVRRHADAALPHAPSGRLDRIERADWWAKHPLEVGGDLLSFAHESDVLNSGGGSAEGSLGNGQPGNGQPDNGISDDYLPHEYQYHVPADVPRALNSQASRNAMGPSLWQLVSAAIPDEVDAGVGDVVGDVVAEDGVEAILDTEEGGKGEERPRRGAEEWPYGEDRKRKRGRGEVFW